jgi:hypothetical protein
MRPLTDGTKQARLDVAFDLLAIVVFVGIGVREHAGGEAAVRILRTATPLLTAWILTSWWLRAYRPPGWSRLALTVLLAVPLGVAFRLALVGERTVSDLVTFAAVAMAFIAILATVGRLLATWIGAQVFGEARERP